MLDLKTLSYIPYGDSQTSILITGGEFDGVQFLFGKTWFPDPDEPVMSFEYEIISETKPSDIIKFQQEIGELLHAMLRDAIEKEKVVYANGTGAVEEAPLEPEPVKESPIITPWKYKVPEPEAGTSMSRNLFKGFK